MINFKHSRYDKVGAYEIRVYDSTINPDVSLAEFLRVNINSLIAVGGAMTDCGLYHPLSNNFLVQRWLAQAWEDKIEKWMVLSIVDVETDMAKAFQPFVQIEFHPEYKGVNVGGWCFLGDATITNYMPLISPSVMRLAWNFLPDMNPLDTHVLFNYMHNVPTEEFTKAYNAGDFPEVKYQPVEVESIPANMFLLPASIETYETLLSKKQRQDRNRAFRDLAGLTIRQLSPTETLEAFHDPVTPAYLQYWQDLDDARRQRDQDAYTAFLTANGNSLEDAHVVSDWNSNAKVGIDIDMLRSLLLHRFGTTIIEPITFGAFNAEGELLGYNVALKYTMEANNYTYIDDYICVRYSNDEVDKYRLGIGLVHHVINYCIEKHSGQPTVYNLSGGVFPYKRKFIPEELGMLVQTPYIVDAHSIWDPLASMLPFIHVKDYSVEGQVTRVNNDELLDLLKVIPPYYLEESVNYRCRSEDFENANLSDYIEMHTESEEGDDDEE